MQFNAQMDITAEEDLQCHPASSKVPLHLSGISKDAPKSLSTNQDIRQAALRVFPGKRPGSLLQIHQRLEAINLTVDV
jgi:hypothetical protein